MYIICYYESIIFIKLQTLITLQAFNNIKAPGITHKISLLLFISQYYKEECILLIINLGYNNIILNIK